MKSGYAGPSVRISDEDLLDCLNICAFPKRELGGITAEESLCSAASSVAPATDAADVAQFVGSLFDAMCKFVAETGSIFLDAVSPDMFRYACTSKLIVIQHRRAILSTSYRVWIVDQLFLAFLFLSAIPAPPRRRSGYHLRRILYISPCC